MEILAGRVVNYYRTKGVASVEVTDCLKAGDRVHIKGHTTNFEQAVVSLQINHKQVTKASKGSVAGLKVNDYVRKHDLIYRVED